MHSNDRVPQSLVAIRTSTKFISPRQTDTQHFTHVRASVILTLLDCSDISFLATCSLRALCICRTTCESNKGARRASMRNGRISCAVTSGGTSSRTASGSNRGPCRPTRSRAGASRCVLLGSRGRRYMRRRVRKILLPGLDAYMRLQYLENGQHRVMGRVRKLTLLP